VSVREIVYLPWETYQLSKINITWGNTMYDHCKLNFTMKELRQRYKDNMTPNYKTGGLGPLMQSHLYEVWVCVEHHFCSTHPTDQVVMNSLCDTLRKWAVYQIPLSCTYTQYRKSSDSQHDIWYSGFVGFFLSPSLKTAKMLPINILHGILIWFRQFCPFMIRKHFLKSKCNMYLHFK